MSKSIAQAYNYYNQALQTLSSQLRKRESSLVKLLYQKGASPEEIASALGISRSNVAYHYPKYRLLGEDYAS